MLDTHSPETHSWRRFRRLIHWFGHSFVDEDGTAGGWNDIWQNFMEKLLKESKVTERFTEHDMRAKVGSDAENLERAKQLLGHADARTTERIYRRKAERITPEERKKL